MIASLAMAGGRFVGGGASRPGTAGPLAVSYLLRALIPRTSAAARRAGEVEADLLARCRQGDPRAFEDLVRRYQNQVFAVALRMLGDRGEAEDLSQEVFLKVFRGLGSFRGEAKFSTWLYSIVSHECLNRLRARRPPRPARAAEREGEEPAVSDPNPDAVTLLERRELAERLEEEIGRLGPEHRAILILRDLQGLSYEEIAEALGLELGTVRSRLHRARAELKERMAPYLSG